MLLCQMCTKVVQVSGKNVSVQMYCHKANERKRNSRQKITTSLEVAAFEVLLDAWHRQIFFWWKEGGNVIWCLLQEDHPLRLAGLIEIFPDCHLWEGRWVGMMLSHEPVPYRDFSGDGLGSYHSQFYFFFSPVLFSYTAEDLMLVQWFPSSRWLRHQLAQRICWSLLLCLFEAIPTKYESELCC